MEAETVNAGTKFIIIAQQQVGEHTDKQFVKTEATQRPAKRQSSRVQPMGLPFLWLLLLLSLTPVAYLPPSTSRPLSALAHPTIHSHVFTREMADEPGQDLGLWQWPSQTHPAPVVINPELKPLRLCTADSACLQPCPWAKTKDL